MNKYTTKYVGLDVHNDTIVIAIADHIDSLEGWNFLFCLLCFSI